MTLADKIKPHRDDLIAAHNNGDNTASQVIRLYQMHCSCPSDRAAPALCEVVFDDWLAARKAGG